VNETHTSQGKTLYPCWKEIVEMNLVDLATSARSMLCSRHQASVHIENFVKEENHKKFPYQR